MLRQLCLSLPPQTGAWGCFDEFNRINIEVLSVVAQQILSILSALAANLTRFHFEGFEINLVWSCGIFITMNPGRWQELNDVEVGEGENWVSEISIVSFPSPSLCQSAWL